MIYSFGVRSSCLGNLRLSLQTELPSYPEGARGAVVIVVGNGHGDSSSIPGRE